MVFVNTEKVEAYRKKQYLTKTEFYALLGIDNSVGRSLLTTGRVSLNITKRVAKVIGLEVQDLVESWDK